MDEEEVIRDILSGNVNRYEDIVKAYQSNVANLCFKMGGNRVDIPTVSLSTSSARNSNTRAG